MNKVEMFNRVCDSLCKYSEMNTGKKCEEKCILSELMQDKEPEPFIKEYVECMKRNIEIANNTYTQMGYEIALDIFKSALKGAGYDTSFMNDEEGTEDD